MSGNGIIKLSLLEAVKNIKNGGFSARELVDETVKHVHSVNYNAILSLYEDDARAAAAAIDQKIAGGDVTGGLLGIPVIIKDNIDVAGYASTCGSAAFRANIAESDAEVVKRLKAAGAIILGKSNMDEFAMGSSNMTSAFGPVLNPFDSKRVPGGSSGGSAVATATYQGFAALGSDTGGSIRQPASYCGVTGLKPTYGSVDGRGCFPLAPSMDQIGPIARTVDDCAAVFSVLAGDNDKFGGDLLDFKSASLSAPLKIGVIKESLSKINGEAGEAFYAALEKLRLRGCRATEVSVPSFMQAHYVYKTVAFSEITQTMRAVCGGRELLGREVKKRIIAGRYILDNPSLLREAEVLRGRLTQEMLAVFEDADVLVLPTAPSAAFRFDDDPLMQEIEFSDLFTQPASIAGLPSLSVPFFKNRAGLPLGIQFVGRLWGERDVFAAGRLLEE